MANYDNPNGFRPISSPARTGVYQVNEACVKGDVLALVSGKTEIFDPSDANHTKTIGVAAESGATDEYIQVYDDPSTCFEGQCGTGTFSAATHLGGAFEVEGASGAMEINLSGTTDAVAVILEHYPITGSDEEGANARVKVVFPGHVALD